MQKHRPSRDQTMSRAESIKVLGESLKKSVVENLWQNINDQTQAGTLVEYASVFDMNSRIGLDEQLGLLKNCTPFMEKITSIQFLRHWKDMISQSSANRSKMQ